MGKKRKVPDTAQLNLLTEDEDCSKERDDAACAEDRFLQGDPANIFIGEVSLRQYLIDHGKGWVIRFRKWLFAQDVSPFRGAYKSTGRKPYHPFVILGLILYGAQQGRWSLRNLEDLAKLDLGAWWICGGLQPDHSTIGDFINLHQDYLTEEFFLALTADLVRRLGLGRSAVAGDGTVIEAASSRFSMLKREAAEQALTRAVKESGEQSDQANRCREAVEAVKSREAKRKAKGRGKYGTKVCPDEPSAVLQPRKDGPKRPSYKPSVLADPHRMIVGQHLEPESEMKSVSPMLAQYNALFDALPERSFWDGNYNTFELLTMAVASEMDCLCGTASGKQANSTSKFGKADFVYDEESEVYRCPAGRLLVYRKSGFFEGRPYRVYQGRDCHACELRTRCTKAQEGRSITRYQGEELKEAMQQVLSQPAAQKQFARRKAMVEPVFGVFACRHDLRRFHRRGLSKVRVEFSLHCMAYNLRRSLQLSTSLSTRLVLYFRFINPKSGAGGFVLADFQSKTGCWLCLDLKWQIE